MYDIFFVIVALILYINGYMAILVWFMAIYTLNMSIQYGNKRIYLEVIEDYPIQDCIVPKKFKFLFKNLKTLSYKNIPKEMYFSELVKYIGLWIYTFIGLITLFLDEKMSVLVGIVYFSVVYGIYICSIFLMVKKSFLSRYKILNRQNMRYLWSGQNGPYSRKVGKCIIVNECKKVKRTIVTVKLLETGELKEKVLLEGKKKEENSVYTLYEICKVYYIV